MLDRIRTRALEGYHAAPEAHTMADWLCVAAFPFLIIVGALSA